MKLRWASFQMFAMWLKKKTYATQLWEFAIFFVILSKIDFSKQFVRSEGRKRFHLKDKSKAVSLERVIVIVELRKPEIRAVCFNLVIGVLCYRVYRHEDGHLEILYNSQLSFHQRQYTDLEAIFYHFRLCQSLFTITKQPLLYVRGMVPSVCFQALSRWLVQIHSQEIKKWNVSEVEGIFDAKNNTLGYIFPDDGLMGNSVLRSGVVRQRSVVF